MAISCTAFYDICRKHGFSFFTGVPDSTFKSWMAFLEDNDQSTTNVTAVNECEATAIGAGYYLSTGDIPVVYMQNDGLGKCINPITTLCDSAVYRVPVLLMIGWRGRPGMDDAPQHHKMGELLNQMLDVLDIEKSLLPSDTEAADSVLAEAKDYMLEREEPYAIIVDEKTFEPSQSVNDGNTDDLSREEAVCQVADSLDGDEIVVSTTGKLSRELYEHRERNGQGHERDFYNVGAMGCTQSIGFSIALNRDEDVVVLDGDGSVLMQMGAMATHGRYAGENFYHCIFDNEAHDSTGGQTTSSINTSFEDVATACGYATTRTVEKEEALQDAIDDVMNRDGPALLVIEVEKGARRDLGRPSTDPEERKKLLMDTLISTDDN